MKVYLGKSNMSSYDDVALFRKWAAQNKIEVEEHVGGDFDQSWPTRNKVLILIPYEPGFLGRGLYEMAVAAKHNNIVPFYATKNKFEENISFKEVKSVAVNNPDDWRYKYGLFTFSDNDVNLLEKLKELFSEKPNVPKESHSNKDLLGML